MTSASACWRPYLLRPKSYLVQRLAEAMGDSLGRLIGVGAAALFALALSGRAVPPPIAFVYVAVLGVLGTRSVCC